MRKRTSLACKSNQVYLGFCILQWLYEELQEHSVDRLFHKEAARRACLMFTKLPTPVCDQTCCMNFITLDAIITCMLTSSRPLGSDLVLHQLAQLATENGNFYLRCCKLMKDEGNQFEGNMYSVIFCTAIFFLLPMAASLFSRQTYSTLCEVLGGCEEEIFVYFIILPEGTETRRLNNSTRSYTAVFRYSGNRHCYISIRLDVFKTHINS